MEEFLNSAESINSILNDAKDDDISEVEGKFLTFWTDRQQFGIPIADVEQIIGMQTITEIPEFPNYVKGVISLRGSIIPVIDVRLRFGKKETEYNERTCIIVAIMKGTLVGFIVDEVNEVADIAADQISLPPQIVSSQSNHYIVGIGQVDERVVLLLDTTALLGKEQLDQILSSVK